MLFYKASDSAKMFVCLCPDHLVTSHQKLSFFSYTVHDCQNDDQPDAAEVAQPGPNGTD